MPGLQDVADLIANIGMAAKMAAADLREAQDASERYATARETSETTSTMAKAGDGTTPTSLSRALQAQAGR